MALSPEVPMDEVMRSALPGHRWDPEQPPAVDPDTGAVNLYGYDDVDRVLRDQATYSMQVLPPEVADQMPLFLGYWGQDEPEHSQLKRIIAPHFGRHAVHGRLATTTSTAVSEAIDGIIEDRNGHFDYMSTLGGVPARVIAGYLGMPTDDPDIHEWLYAFNSGTSTPEQEADMHQRFLAHLETRQDEFPEGAEPTNPTDALVAAQRDKVIIIDEALSDRWATAQIQMLYSAGDHTTTAAIANGLQGMSEQGVLSQFPINPEAARLVTEEIVRHWPPFPRAHSMTKQEVEVGTGGDRQILPAGTLVHAWISAANHDISRFENPYIFMPGRNPNPHLGWGESWRACTGAHLARFIMNATIQAAVRRLPGLEWDGRQFDRTQSFVPLPREGQLGFVYDANRLPE